MDADSFLSIAETFHRLDPQLTRLAAAMIAAASLGIACDSRSFARIFGVEHALVIRELEGLVGRELVAVEKTDPRTLRTGYRLTSDAQIKDIIEM